MIATVAWHRRAVLTVGLAAAVAAAVLAALLPGVRTAVVLSLLGAMALFLVTGLGAGWAMGRRRRATLLVDPDGPAFATPRLGPMVFLGLAVTTIPAFVLTALLLEPDGGRAAPGRLLLIVSGVVVIGGAANLLFGLWRGVGVRLTPAGIAADVYAGSLAVPWSALAAEQPRWDPEHEYKLPLAYARPELVTTRGLVLNRGEVLFEGVDDAFLAAAVAHYAADPAHRAGIGTVAELDRLLDVLPGVAPLPPAEQERADADRRRAFRRDVAIGTGLAAAAIATGGLLPGGPGWSLLTGLLTAAGGGLVSDALRRRRAVRRAARGL